MSTARRPVLALAACLAQASLTIPATARAAEPPPPARPNFLFILVDDQSPFDFKFYNPQSPLPA
ncbi:MAG: hypothetical protein FJ387_23705, partial [Verrucomicrobia bacterium]|nr:hypothetical protein [Verrucomicrobiota bacterium]